MNGSAKRNIELYPWYQAATGFLPWMPVFFLYFSSTVSLNEAIELGAIYYLSVVLFEVPSGYLSDRFGRRTTLLLASTFAIISYAVFIAASSFGGFVIGQIFLSGMMAFQSGSDNSLLYDSLIETNRENEYAEHESRAHQFNLLSLAISVLLGGVLGAINLKLPYAAALVVALAAFVLCAKFTEPQRIDNSQAQAFLPQLVKTIGSVRNPILLWILCFYIIGYCLQHVPYEFYQPYISLLQSKSLEGMLQGFHPAIVSGVVIGLSMLGGALGANASVRMTTKFGARTLMLTAIAIQTLIIALMAIWLHPAVLLIIVFRNFSMAMTHAPMHALIAPRIQSAQRATYLSLQSLAGRLAFSSMLFVIADNTGASLNWPTLSWMFKVSVFIGLICFAALVFYAHVLKNPSQPGR